MSEELKHIETFPAGEFICDECGRNSYFSLVTVEDQLDEEELKDLNMKLNGGALIEGATNFWMMHPLVVKCHYCKTEYSTFNEDETVEENDQYDVDQEDYN